MREITPKHSPRRDLRTTLIESSEGFENLEAEWNDLYLDSPTSTPFQSFGWLFSWWRAYAPPESSPPKLTLVTLRDGTSGLLVGVLPLMVRRRFGVEVLGFIGEGITDYLDVVVREGWEREVTEVGAAAIGEIPGWSVGDFRQLRPDAAVFGVLEPLGLRLERIREEGYPKIVAPDWDSALTGAAGTNLRSMARRSVRRLAADGVERASVPPEAPPDEIAAAARNFVALHREYWTGRDISPEHLTGRFAEHMVASAKRMVPKGTMEIREFHRKGEVLASHIIMVGDGYAGQMLSGAGSGTRKRYQLSSLFVYDGFTVSERVGADGFDLLRGEEPYKLRWNPEVVPGTRVVFGRKVVLHRLYLTSIRAYGALREQAHTEDAPPQIRQLLFAYTGLRSRLARWRNRG